jgi:transcription initiation factor TFIID subunit 2
MSHVYRRIPPVLILLQYSDAFYICSIISAVASATVCTKPPEKGELLKSEVRVEQTTEDAELLKQAMAEVERYRSMDRLIQSPHNIVTIAALEVGRFRCYPADLQRF